MGLPCLLVTLAPWLPQLWLSHLYLRWELEGRRKDRACSTCSSSEGKAKPSFQFLSSQTNSDDCLVSHWNLSALLSWVNLCSACRRKRWLALGSSLSASFSVWEQCFLLSEEDDTSMGVEKRLGPHREVLPRPQWTPWTPGHLKMGLLGGGRPGVQPGVLA